MPENIAKYSPYVIQQITNSAIDPSNVLLAWIVAWAFAEPTELLAMQIKKQVRAELPTNFEEAFSQAIQLMSDPGFRAASIGAFGMAISKFKIREDIKALAFDAPTERVLEGLRKIAAESPRMHMLDALIRDIEYIQRMKASTMPTPKPQEQVSPGVKDTFVTAPSIPTPQYPPQPEQDTSNLNLSSQVITPGVHTTNPSSIKLEEIKAAMTEVMNSALGNRIDDLFKLVKELSGAIETVESSMSILKKKIDEISLEVQSIKNSIESLSVDTSRSKAQAAVLDTEVVRALEEAAKMVGFDIIATSDEHPPKETPVEIPDAAPTVVSTTTKEKVSAEEVPIGLPPLPQLFIETRPKGAEEPKVASQEIPPLKLPPIGISEKPPVVSQPPPTKVKPREIELLIPLLGDMESLRKITNILSAYKVGPFRWQLHGGTEAIRFKATIQAMVKGLPPSTKKELIEKAQGLIISVETSIPEDLDEVIKQLKNIKFIIWLGTKPKLKISTRELVIESGSLSDKGDIINLLQKVLQKINI